jgi:hypothetical protein
MSNFLKILAFPFVKIFKITKGINDAIEAPTKIGQKADRSFKIITKVTGATSGSIGAAKGVCDSMEALACQDGVCFVVSVIGTCADTLQILASFVPGPNVTITVTTPISAFCKTFVYCCKRSKIPWWGNC